MWGWGVGGVYGVSGVHDMYDVYVVCGGGVCWRSGGRVNGRGRVVVRVGGWVRGGCARMSVCVLKMETHGKKHNQKYAKLQKK